MRKLIILSLIVGLMSGCSTGTIITKEGTTELPKWHQAEKVIFNKDSGTFPNLQSLNQLREGMTKDQLYELIGRPQYDDGWRPREWNYLFHFTTPGQGSNNVTTCQFKVLFDQNMYARSFYWNPINPQDGVCPPVLIPPAKKPIAEKVSTQRYTLGADALFKFDKSDIQNLNPKGRVDLDNLIAELGKFKVLNAINILGYTDRLGSVSYNQKLSQDRADSIKQYLVNRGINPIIVNSQGQGSAQPVTECENNLSRTQLINCLAPNRRVVVDVDGYIE
ncbi:OmpA family protein [Acinetobacter sp. MD2(2019)]|uniref:OmpA family protein n=1 Tax=Acinetobacter sp. MD2(2019) TaxID=2605273 RepID=UPI002D1E78D9|nr:OmpA family protein [Acinetobacter sp. MD2(2019)]MEB3754190.1 OmpA family protein [Acinetobacter sp. MD2(2019)]